MLQRISLTVSSGMTFAKKELERYCPLGSWEQTISSFFHLLRLDTIKRKILVFSLLATLIPCLSMGWLSYVNNKQFLQGKISQELVNVTSHTAREIELWVRDHRYNVRVFSSSYEVSENLEKILRYVTGGARAAKSLRRLKDYLKLVRGKFVAYEELMVLDQKGEVKASSAEKAGIVEIMPAWLRRVKKGDTILGNAYREESLKKTVMIILQPIKGTDGHFLGVFAAKVNLGTIDELLGDSSFGKKGKVYVITEDGRLIISSQSKSPLLMKTQLAAETAKSLFKKEGVSLEYRDYSGETVVGTLKRVPLLRWAVVAQVGREEAYAQIVRLRNLTLLVVSGLLIGIGLTASLLGLNIVRPLERLSKGAAEVAGGNLEVDLPVISRGEVGYLTEVFNYMVSRLRRGRKELAAINKTLREKNKELEELSVTDGLTGLYNHKHLVENLKSEVERAQRYNRPFSILMIDIDYFKKYNDTFGHQAGDEVLSKIGAIFKKSVRSVDYAARYGGEEFFIMLPETRVEGAVKLTERIRTQVSGQTFGNDKEKVKITLSIGVAQFPENGETSESIIASADAALFEAKRLGRNRVVQAGVCSEMKSKAAKQ